ncbi:hypothetical protein B0H13DRAFT_2361034 [Mycena leptocephala]|nr:hypothetical protein B0H13DRAFT_2361034 [Mycena leptocephala]
MSDAPPASRKRAVHTLSPVPRCVGSMVGSWAVEAHAAPNPVNPSMSPSLDFTFDVDIAYLSLILRPRLDRASNDASICPRHPPGAGLPLTPLSGVAASSPSASFLRRLMPTPNTRLQTDHPTVRVVLLCYYVSISPTQRPP